MPTSVALLVLVFVALPLPAVGQAKVPPDTNELTLLGLGYRADSADVIRVLGLPDSIRSHEHPFDVGARLQTWYYPNVLIFFNGEGRRDGMKLILPGVRTRRGLAVGDRAGRAQALYGAPDDASAAELRWGIGGRTDPQLVVEIRNRRVKSIFVGHIID